MPQLYLLGTGAAVSDPHRTTTMLAFSDAENTVVVDCGGDVVQRLMSCNVDLKTIRSLIITHEHPDHVSGFPLFMEKIWLAGRREPIPVYGIEAALSQARRIFEAFNTSGWTGLPEIRWRTVEHVQGAQVLEDETWSITAAPVVHPVPIIGIRVLHRPTGHVVAYSCDTEPTDAVVFLGREADILVHEANGEGKGHTSIPQAAQIAEKAKARKLILVHVPAGLTQFDIETGHPWFSNIDLGEEQGVYSF